ncbi:MAG: D-2-hydroxyacid dehydrogenase [Bacteroidales bacterium]|nr:D-2-hydroxyacid dehydrogenase [Bacteroidales bacterium]
MYKIVILDADTLGDDINLTEIEQFGEITKYGTTSNENTANRIKDADIVISNKVFIGNNEVENAKNLKLVCVAATGYNNIDIKALNSKNIAVTNVKGYSTQSVAQLVFASILNIYGSVSDYNTIIRKGEWQKSPTFNMLNFPINDLEGKVIGIIGHGSIGKKVEQIAKAFDMKVILLGFNNRKYPESEHRYNKEEFFKKSDFVTIHCPLTTETKNLISANELNMMKSSAILINTARGPVVNTDDLYNALKNKTIRAAVFDVFEQEPPKNHPIFSLNNAYITPHIAWASFESRQRLIAGIAYNIRCFIDGNIDEIRIR